MFNREELKKNARKTVKNNYWIIIFVCFLSFIFANSYSYTNDNIVKITYNIPYTNLSDTNYDVTNNIIDVTLNNKELINKDEVTGGAFKFIFNILTKFEKILFNFVNSIVKIFIDNGLNIDIKIILFFIGIIYNIFIVGPLSIGESRFFLETRLYKKTRLNRLFYSFKKNRYSSVVKTNLRKDIYLFLWSFTIIGVVIKHYSYRLVSYISAENPKLSSKQVIDLSRKMMNGYKWNMFKLDCSFFGWYLLNYLTFGLLGLLYMNPYLKSTEAEVYTFIKTNSNDKDKWLQILNDDKLIQNDNLDYYPSIEVKERFNASKKFDYYRKYKATSLILLFFTFSILGFLWEISIHFLQYGDFVKRGALLGPWLPIYGSGCIIVLLLLIPKKLKRITDNPTLTFLLVMLICSIIEYSTSVYLEFTKGARWWDYTGFFLNINGRVCLEGSLFFGLGGIACIYFIAPKMDNLFSKLSRNFKIVLCSILVLLLLCDFTYSHFYPNMGAGISKNNYNHIKNS